MKSNGSLLYSLVLVVGDFFALLAAFAGAYILRVSIDHRPIAHSVHAATYLELFLLLLPFWILFFALMGLYSTSIQEKRFIEASRLLIGSFLGLFFVTSYRLLRQLNRSSRPNWCQFMGSRWHSCSC